MVSLSVKNKNLEMDVKTMKSVTIRLVFCMLLLIMFLVLPGCGGSDNKLDIAGSTTVQPLAEKLAIAYMKDHSELEVVVTGGGSSTGITSVANGIVDIGTSSRELRENESAVLTQYKIALDGIAVIVHPSLNIKSLTTEQVAAIFTGNITNWKYVGGPDMRIDVVTRESGSGTRDTFELKVLNGRAIIDNALQQPSSGAIRSTVAGLPSSISYVSIAYIDESVKGLDLNGKTPSFESVNDGSWPLMRPLLLLTRGPAKGKAKDFIDFCLSPEGQEIVMSEVYAGVE